MQESWGTFSDRVSRLGWEQASDRPMAWRAPWRHLDPTVVLAAIALTALGLLAIYSSTFAGLRAQGLPEASIMRRQLLNLGLGVAVMVAAMVVDYRRLQAWAGVVFGAVVVALLLVLTPLGSATNGAQSWFELGAYQVQPSEYAKVGAIVTLAAVFGARREARAAPAGRRAGRHGPGLRRDPAPARLRHLHGIRGHPVRGAAGQRGPAALAAGAGPGRGDRHGRHVQAQRAAGVPEGAPDRVHRPERRRRWTRLHLQLETGADRHRLGRGHRQGYLRGSQTNLQYVPEQKTDFIFTVIGEELGFAGAMALLALLALLLWRGLRIAAVARDPFGALLATGVVTMLAFQAS